MQTAVRDRVSPARLLPQALKFGAVGAVGFVVNVVVFNALLLTVFSPALHHKGPIYATVVATVIAIVANWIGNRYWAFSAQRQSNTLREGAEFMLVSLVGMGIPLLCLWLSHYVLGYTSLLADNIANNVIGLALGTVFRFAFYRWWVFAPWRGKTAQLDFEDAAKAQLPAAPDGGLPAVGLIGEN